MINSNKFNNMKDNKSIQYIGITETISVVAGILICCFVCRLIYHTALASSHIYQILLTIIILISAIYGPYSGFVIGSVGNYLALSFVRMPTSIEQLMGIAFAGLIVGFFSGRFGIREGKFSQKDFVLFNIIQMSAIMLCMTMLSPFLQFVFTHSNLYETVDSAISASIISVILTGIICTPVLFLISCIIKKNKSKMNKGKFKPQ